MLLRLSSNTQITENQQFKIGNKINVIFFDFFSQPTQPISR